MKKTKSRKTSQAFKKIKDYIKWLTLSEPFLYEVKKFRRKYKIPIDGHTKKIYNWYLNLPFDKDLMDYNYKWKENSLKLPVIIGPKNKAEKRSIYKDAEIIENKFLPSYNSGLWSTWLYEYLFFGVTKIEDGMEDLWSICTLGDTEESKKTEVVKKIFSLISKDPSKIDGIVKNIIKREKDRENKSRPIKLHISPHASLDDVIDFLKKHKREFYLLKEKYQSEHNLNIGKVRSRLTLERNQFIYKKKGLPRKKIVELVERKFKEKLREEYIRNIISREKKTREV